MIPKVIHHIWVGGPMPEHLAAYVATWSELHPDWEHRLWGDDDLDWLTNQDLFDRADEFVGPREVGQLRADVARLEILHRHGGVYVDADMEALRPIDDLLDVGCFAGFEDRAHRWVNNAILGAEAGHPFLADLIDRLPGSVERARTRRPNVMSGPQFVTPIWRRRWRGHVTVHPSRAFYPYSWADLDAQGGDYGDAYTAHHWHHRRSTK